MSTNYYVRTPQTAPEDEGIHLGKWTNGEFHFRAYPAGADRPGEITWDVVDLTSWTLLLGLGDVVTEARRPVTSDEMLTEIQRECTGDAFFPEFDDREWLESERRESGALVFRTLVRRTPTLPRSPAIAR